MEKFVGKFFQVCCPSKTDPTVTPADGENLFVLVPVAPGLEDTDEIRNQHYWTLINNDELQSKGNLTMVKIAILHKTITGQIKEGAGRIKGLEIVYTGRSLEGFLKKAKDINPQVLVIDINMLGQNPKEELEKLQKEHNLEMYLVVYQFAKKDVVQGLDTETSKPIRGPVSLEVLRMNLMSLLVKEVMDKSREARDKFQKFRDGDGGSSPSRDNRDPAVSLESQEEYKPVPRRYSPSQLGRLQEIASAVDCECPNHMASIVSSLTSFEDYSKDCENLNEEDAKIHRMLYLETAKARFIMEEALKKLCEFEKIVL